LRCGLVGVNCFGGGLEGLGLVEIGLGVVVLRGSSLSAGFPLSLNCSKYLCKAWKLESGDPSILLLTLLSGVGWEGRGTLSVAVAKVGAKVRVGVMLRTDSTKEVMVPVTTTASTTWVVFHLFWNLSDISLVV